MLVDTLVKAFSELQEFTTEEVISRRDVRVKALGNHEVCKMKKHDWGVKSIVEVSAIHALLEPGNTSFTIYFLSVLIVQFSEAYWNRSTMEVIERVTAQILKRAKYWESHHTTNIEEDEKPIISSNSEALKLGLGLKISKIESGSYV